MPSYEIFARRKKRLINSDAQVTAALGGSSGLDILPCSSLTLALPTLNCRWPRYFPATLIAARDLQWSSTMNDTNYYDYNRDNQQDVDEST